MQTREPILACRDLSVIYPNGTLAVQDISLNVYKRECVALVGESGSGKTTIGRAALGLLPWGSKVTGSIQLAGREVVQADIKTLRSLRGLVAGFVAQDPFGACNPLHKVRTHVSEAWAVHGKQPSKDVVIRSLEELGILDARNAAERYPHQWSGGMLQRATIGAANAHQPLLIIADEPTSALDAELADSTISLLRSRGTAILLISHDLELVARHADRIVHLNAGRVTGNQLPGDPSPRSTIDNLPARVNSDQQIVLDTKNVSRSYGEDPEKVWAVVDASLQVRRGEVVGIYGNSGSGKSSLLRLLATIESPTSGSLALDGKVVEQPFGGPRAGFVMPIFQDPIGSLDHRWPLWRIITEPLTAKHRIRRLSRSERRRLARVSLDEVGMREVNLDTRPNNLSIGQCQRVSIARSLMAEPALILADEPTSALDRITANRILDLLRAATLKGVAIIIVSHDQSMLREFCDHVYRMHEGVLETEVLRARGR